MRALNGTPPAPHIRVLLVGPFASHPDPWPCEGAPGPARPLARKPRPAPLPAQYLMWRSLLHRVSGVSPAHSPIGPFGFLLLRTQPRSLSMRAGVGPLRTNGCLFASRPPTAVSPTLAPLARAHAHPSPRPLASAATLGPDSAMAPKRKRQTAAQVSASSE